MIKKVKQKKMSYEINDDLDDNQNQEEDSTIIG